MVSKLIKSPKDAGRSPDIWLKDTSRYRKLPCKRPIVLGKLPVKWLPYKITVINRMHWTMDVGMVPVIWFLYSIKYSKWIKVPTSVGKTPVISLLFKASTRNAVNLVISLGIWPFKLIRLKSISVTLPWLLHNTATWFDTTQGRMHGSLLPLGMGAVYPNAVSTALNCCRSEESIGHRSIKSGTVVKPADSSSSFSSAFFGVAIVSGSGGGPWPQWSKQAQVVDATQLPPNVHVVAQTSSVHASIMGIAVAGWIEGEVDVFEQSLPPNPLKHTQWPLEHVPRISLEVELLIEAEQALAHGKVLLVDRRIYAAMVGCGRKRTIIEKR